jgi:hypothetical protein
MAVMTVTVPAGIVVEPAGIGVGGVVPLGTLVMAFVLVMKV